MFPSMYVPVLHSVTKLRSPGVSTTISPSVSSQQSSTMKCELSDHHTRTHIKQFHATTNVSQV